MNGDEKFFLSKAYTFNLVLGGSMFSISSKVRLILVVCLWSTLLCATLALADTYKSTGFADNPVGSLGLNESSGNGTVANSPFSNSGASKRRVKSGASGSPLSTSSSTTTFREDNRFVGFSDDQVLSITEAAKTDWNKPTR